VSHDYALRCLDHGKDTPWSRRACLAELWAIRESVAMLYRVMSRSPTLDPDLPLCGCGDPPSMAWFDNHRDCAVILVSDVGHDPMRFDLEKKAWVAFACPVCKRDVEHCRFNGANESLLVCVGCT
jgi:hypothetical protein